MTSIMPKPLPLLIFASQSQSILETHRLLRHSLVLFNLSQSLPLDPLRQFDPPPPSYSALHLTAR